MCIYVYTYTYMHIYIHIYICKADIFIYEQMHVNTIKCDIIYFLVKEHLSAWDGMKASCVYTPECL